MSCHRVVMVAGNNGMVEGSIIRNVNPSLVCEEASIVMPVRKGGAKVGRDFSWESMEHVKDKRVRCQGRAQLVQEGGVYEIDKQHLQEESDGLVVCIHRRYMVRPAREGIRGTEILARNILKSEVKFCEIKQPLCSALIEIARLTEISQVFVVHENLDHMRGSKKIMLPSIKGSHDSEQFMIINVVISFGWAECLGKIGARVPFAIGVFLQEDSSGCVFGGICGDSEWRGEVWEMEDQLGSECKF